MSNTDTALFDSLQETILTQLEKLEEDQYLSSKDRIEIIHRLLPFVMPKKASVRPELSEEEKIKNDPIAKYLN